MALKKVESKNKTGGKMNPRRMLEEHRQTYADKMQEELENQGVKFFVPDDNLNIDRDYLTLPRNITDVPSKELGEYLNAFTQQKMYMRTLLGWAELLLEEKKREYHAVADEQYRELNRSKMTEKAKELEVNSMPEVIVQYNDMQDVVRKISLLNLSLENITDALFMLSREVSRRGSDFDNENRNMNVQNR